MVDDIEEIDYKESRNYNPVNMHQGKKDTYRSGALPSKMLLVRIKKNIRIQDYFRSG